MSFPDLGSNVPRKGQPRMVRSARWLLSRLGWYVDGRLPNHQKFVVIVAYHTSNWDFFVGMAAMFALDLQVSWVAKHTIFRWPFKALLRVLGGKPVNRTEHHGVVQHVIELFREHDQFVFAITPEGTRSPAAQWKTGFYHIAVGAEVVIVPAYVDYPGRRLGFGPAFVPTGNLERDLADLQHFYEPYKKTAARPDRV